MIELPGSFSGRRSSPRPERGPEASSRMSLAILNSATASVFSAPWAKASGSWPASAANLFAAGANDRLSSRLAQTRVANSGWVLRPVPTAVPPMASSWSPPSAALTAPSAC